MDSMTWTNPDIRSFGIDIFTGDLDDVTKDFSERPEIKFVYGPQTTVDELKEIIYTSLADRETKRVGIKPSKTLANKNYHIQVKKNGRILADDFIMPDIDSLQPREKNAFMLVLRKKLAYESEN